MLLLKFFVKESALPYRRIVLTAIVAGGANGLLLGLINAAAANAADEQVEMRLFLLYMLTLISYIYARRFSMLQAVERIERIIQRVRIRITSKIRSVELSFVENIDRSEVYTRLSQDANLISQSAFILVNALSSAIMLVAGLVYIGYISMVALLCFVVTLSLGIGYYFSHRRALMSELHEATEKEAEFFSMLNHVLDGFKEIRINQKKSNALHRRLLRIAAQTERLKTLSGYRLIDDIMLSDVFQYTLIAIIIFALPLLVPDLAPEITKLTAATLLIMGSVNIVVGAAPLIARSTVAIENIQRLEGSLDEAGSVEDSIPQPLPFTTIAFNGLTYSYSYGDPPFKLGPISLELKRGDILFLVGGNGSGKSTLLKAITGLYPLDSGSIAIDGVPLSKKQRVDFRDLFSIIFSDFHLFDRLYGIDDIDEEKVNRLIEEMGLGGKTRFENGAFTTANLSTGQRKRLALVAALMEDKEIYILDEWAADQDPDFRRHFYTVILPELKKRGKIVIAATHDDHYFKYADAVIGLEYGRLKETTWG